MFSTVVRYFYPELKKEEIRRFSLLAGTFFLIIGVYWLLRLMKDTIFFKVAFPVSLGWMPNQGRLFQPIAKTISIFVVIGAVLIYSKLVDIFKKHQLFYVICSFYTVMFTGVGVALLLKEWYGAEFLGKTILGATGWASYFVIETFGSLVVALFWSFTNSITDSDAAKRGFPLIIAGAQIGAVLGSALLLLDIGSLWPLMMLSAVLLVCVMLMIYNFMRVIPESEMIGNKAAHATEKKKEGFFEGFVSGLILLVTRPYLLGVFVVSTFYEAIGQIIDYQMKATADLCSWTAVSENAFAKFLALFGVCANALSLIIALLGTSYIIKRFGTRISLMIFPVGVAIALVVLLGYVKIANPVIEHILWAFFGVNLLVRCLTYAVNNPTKEIMYIPTSRDAKFKSKGWIDTFGSRTAKAGGAQITGAFKHDLTQLLAFGIYFGLGLVAVWAIAAFYVGLKNKELVDKGEIVQ